MANGDLIKLGTLYLNEDKIARPQYPWPNGFTAVIDGEDYNSDIVNGSEETIEIRDTDAEESYQIYWREVQDVDKTLYIADRNLLGNIVWNNLYNQDLIFGKEIKIDGRSYLLRVLTGGTQERDGYYAGANPQDNEWDRIICNEGNFSGLPMPSYADISPDGDSMDNQSSEHNTFWNWWNMYSWCQETKEQNTENRTHRGCLAASYFGMYGHFTETSSECGWRPVLEALNTPPTISGEDEDLGNASAPVVYTYSVEDVDGDLFDITESLDDILLRTLKDQTSGSTYTIDLTDQWKLLDNGRYTIKIVAKDSNGLSSTRSVAFTKTNGTPEKPTITSHVDGHRIDPSFYVEFQPGTDPEDDEQTLQLQVAGDPDFTEDLQTFTDLQKQNGNDWVSVTGVHNSDSGSTFRIQATGIGISDVKYLRVGATDEAGSKVTSWSDVVRVSIGGVLEFQTKPFGTDYQPSKIIVTDNKVVDPKATLALYVCNNALDDAPVWEDATEAYESGTLYTFSNDQKTADRWATAVRYVVTASDATGEISISSVGAGVN